MSHRRSSAVGSGSETVGFSLGFSLLCSAAQHRRKLSGPVALILGLVAVVFLVTSAMSFCPAYLPFKISTARRK
jgi:hypothetical protein